MSPLLSPSRIIQSSFLLRSIPRHLTERFKFMCGIYLCLSRTEVRHLDSEICAKLKARGPDSLQTIYRSVRSPGQSAGSDDARALHLTFSSSVLALRGDSIQSQPLVDPESGSVLCWNGEAWKFDGHRIDENDAHFVFRELLAAASTIDSSHHIIEVLTRVTGPFAFAFYDANASTIYYGRDRLGRRSLVFEHPDSESFTLCSIDCDSSTESTEVSTALLHALTLSGTEWVHETYPWKDNLPTINHSVPPPDIPCQPSHLAVDALIHHLRASLHLRITNVPVHSLQHQANQAKVAVLFSGGLDCTLLARIIHEMLPAHEPVDLLNVAFENPRALQQARVRNVSAYEICPDRVTGRKSFAELSQICSDRDWRFVAIDVPFSEVIDHRSTIVSLMKPHKTEMDLSIAMALYFAARGKGNITDRLNMRLEPTLYTTAARVLISGLGADELFGGYSRHATAFTRHSYTGLVDELILDFERIGHRNLGRDDRVMSHWGKEVHYPYLDEDFVNFALSLPVWDKCGFRPDRPLHKHYETTSEAPKEQDLDPAKTLLRLAAWKLGMKSVASERKRAIQFGARTAKMEAGAGRKKGTDILT